MAAMKRRVTERDEAVRLMIEAGKDFDRRGWMLGTSGNLSVVTAADPLRFWVTASGKSKGALTDADFVEVDAEGQSLQPDAPKTSAETLVHVEIYRRTDAGAVFHVHQVHAALCSSRDEERGEVVMSGLEMLKGLDIWDPNAVVGVPLVPNHAHIPALAVASGEALRPGVPGVLICRHGLYAWGRDPFEARRHVEVFDYLFQYSFFAQLGGIR
jgi:methylthioribulose-1-phosphate dehydratase